jgi:Calcium binding
MLWCSPPAEVMLPKSRKNSTREERIDYEIVVGAYGPEERAMGWYYYLQDKVGFPFRAKCTASRVVSPLKKGETVEVLRLAPEDACSGDMLVLIRWHDRKVAIPLSQLTAIDENESADQALADWMGSARLPILNLSGPNLSYAALPKGHEGLRSRQ